jgi:hypothetical protein
MFLVVFPGGEATLPFLVARTRIRRRRRRSKARQGWHGKDGRLEIWFK